MSDRVTRCYDSSACCALDTTTFTRAVIACSWSVYSPLILMVGLRLHTENRFQWPVKALEASVDSSGALGHLDGRTEILLTFCCAAVGIGVEGL